MRKGQRVAQRFVRREGNDEDGFTLVEVVVTLALVAVLSLVMLALTSQLRSIQAAQKQNDAAVELEALAGSVESMIGNVRSLPLTRDNPQRRFLLRGGAGGISFVGVTRVGVAAHGLRDIVIAREGETKRLFLELHPRRVEKSAPPPETVILSEKATVRFWYRGKGESRNPLPDWSDEWLEPGALPLAVRFELSIEKDDKVMKTTRLVLLRAGR